MRNEHEQEAGFQREVSTNRGASRSWEHDRDMKWSYFVGQSEGKAKVDSDWF